jgi:hypothetical protein
MKNLFLSGIASLSMFTGLAQTPIVPQQYICYQTAQPLQIDGKLTEAAWQKAQWTSLFVDIEGDKKPLPLQATKAKILWDKQYLYIAAELDEKHIWAYQSRKDQVVFLENDFEVFIDPDGDSQNYFELEINARNNTFDLFLPKPYRNGGNALVSWDIKDLKTAVSIEGTLNNANDSDKRWTIEMAIPFSSISMGMEADIPKDLSLWRINFSRVEWQHEVVNGKYVRKKKADQSGVLPEYNWVWSPQDVIDMHIPDRWGYLIFSEKVAGAEPIHYTLPEREIAKRAIWTIYHLQKGYFAKHNQYAFNTEELGVDKGILDAYQIAIEATKHTFAVQLQNKQGDIKLHINQEAVLR